MIEQLWQHFQALQKQVEDLQKQLENQSKTLKKTAANSSIPPSQGFKPNLKLKQTPGVKRQASVGRKSEGRELHPEPNQIPITQLKQCPQCGAKTLPPQQQLQARHDNSRPSPPT